MKDRYRLQNTIYGTANLTDYQKNPWKGPPISKQTQGKFGLENELKEVSMIFSNRSFYFIRKMLLF